MQFWRRLAAAALIAATFATAPLADAQQTQAPAPASDQLEDIVITARKVEEPEQRVPVTVTALSQKNLDQQIVLDVQDLETSTPGLYVANNTQGNSPTFAIRGAKTSNGTSPTVAVYLDDVPVNSTYAVANMVYDMQSISTLYGPQGTLFGANSTGGAIVFRPNKPTDTFDGYVQIGYGDYNRKEFQAMVNLPVNEVLQFRFAGEVVRRDGFQTNLTPNGPDNNKMDGDDHDSLRGSMRLKLSDTLLNDTVIDYYHFDDQPITPAVAALLNYDYPTFVGVTVPLNWSAAGVTTLPLSSWDVRNATAIPTWNKGTFYGVGNTTTWDVTPNWNLKNVIGYRNDSQDQSTVQSDVGTTAANGPYVTSAGRVAYNTQQWTLEPSSTVTWDDGRYSNKTGLFLFYSHEFEGLSYIVNDLAFDYTGLPASEETLVQSFYPLGVNVGQWWNRKSEALYDQFSVKLSDELTFTAGARYTYDQQDYKQGYRINFPSSPGAGIPGLGPYGNFFYGPCDAAVVSTLQNYNAADCTGTLSLNTNAPSFTLSLEDRFAERKMLYASLTGGYIEGGFNEGVSVPAGQTFQPEKVTEFEGGLKADWNVAGRPLRTNVAIFYGTYRDQQRVQDVITADGVGYQAVENAGSTLFYGTDVELKYAATSYLDLEASWEYLIAQYTNYNATLSVPLITAAYDLTGAQEAQAPKDVFTAAATLKWPLPERMGALSTTLSYYYRSWSYGQDGPTIGGSCAGNTAAHPVTTCIQPGQFIPNPAQNYTAYDILPAFGLANATTQWKGIAGTHVDAQLWVKNLTNKLYYTLNENQMLNYGYAAYFPGDPRTFGLRLRYNF